jgi:DNA polymerase-3 subunit epsilon
MKFYSGSECRTFLEKLCSEFTLCPKYCHLQSNVSSCFHYQLKQCNGVCKDEESITDYNLRVLQAIESIKFKAEHFVIQEQGRTPKENAYVLIVNGIYKGFGYAPKSSNLTSVSDYTNIITSQKDTTDVKRILNSYLKKHTETTTIFDNVVIEINSFDLFAS